MGSDIRIKLHAQTGEKPGDFVLKISVGRDLDNKDR